MILRRPRIATLEKYAWETMRDFPEDPVERVLDAARARGLVREYDTGRGRICWFEGARGPKLRALRSQVERLLLPYGATRLRDREHGT